MSRLVSVFGRYSSRISKHCFSQHPANVTPPASDHSQRQRHWQPKTPCENRKELVSTAPFSASLLAPPGATTDDSLRLADVAYELNRKGHLAAYRIIRQLAEEEDADLNSKLDGYGNTPAHYLAYMADKLSADEIVFLIAKGVDFHAPNCFGDTPIMRASRIHVSKAPFVEMIQGCGKDAGTEGRAPISGCAFDCWYSYKKWNDPYEICQMIDQRIITPYLRDNIGWTPFHYLARHNMHSQLKRLYDIAADDSGEAKARELINATDGYGDSPLSDAAYWDKSETAKLLLSLGADPNVVNKLGQTPAHRAIISNLDNPSLEVAKLLIDRTDIRHVRNMPSQLELHEGKHIREIVEYIRKESFHALFFASVEKTSADLDGSTNEDMLPDDVKGACFTAPSSLEKSYQNQRTNVQSIEERTHSYKPLKHFIRELSMSPVLSPCQRPSLPPSVALQQSVMLCVLQMLDSKALESHNSGQALVQDQPPSPPLSSSATPRFKRSTKRRPKKEPTTTFIANGCDLAVQGERVSVNIINNWI